jgi:hypothetical protein
VVRLQATLDAARGRGVRWRVAVPCSLGHASTFSSDFMENVDRTRRDPTRAEFTSQIDVNSALTVGRGDGGRAPEVAPATLPPLAAIQRARRSSTARSWMNGEAAAAEVAA